MFRIASDLYVGHLLFGSTPGAFRAPHPDLSNDVPAPVTAELVILLGDLIQLALQISNA
jgi:hypothetical protein